MKKALPLLIGAAVVLGAVGLGQAVTPHPPAAVARALDLVALDLSSKGLPLVIDVPAGTTATKVADGGPEYVRLSGPGFHLTVWPDEYAAAKSVFDTRRDMDKGERTVVASGPTAYRYKGDEHSSDQMGILLGGPKQKTCFTIFGTGPEKMTDKPFTTEQSDVMFASAKGARIKTTAAPAAKAPVKKN